MQPSSCGFRTWGRELSFAPADDGVWMATGDDYEVEFLDWAGATVRRIRWLGPPRNVTATHISAFRERICRRYRLLDSQNWRARCNKRWGEEEPYLPSTFPSVARLLIADDGRLWVEHFHRPGESRHWLVFNKDGTWASSLRCGCSCRTQVVTGFWFDIRRTTWMWRRSRSTQSHRSTPGVPASSRSRIGLHQRHLLRRSEASHEAQVFPGLGFPCISASAGNRAQPRADARGAVETD